MTNGASRSPRFRLILFGAAQSHRRPGGPFRRFVFFVFCLGLGDLSDLDQFAANVFTYSTVGKGFDPPLATGEVEQALGGRFSGLTAIKAGGQGAVFRSVDKLGGPDVALKILFTDQVEERTQREVDALQTLKGKSKHLVDYRGHGKCTLRGQVCAWIATTFIEGESLATVLGRGALSEEWVAIIACHLGEAIRLLWTGRVVHRDIKPDNIMVDTHGNTVLIDLGVARHVDRSPLTTTGKTWGTEGYLSPEQVQAIRDLTCRSDVFALAIVLQQCLLGRHPTGGNQMTLVRGGPNTAGLRAGLHPQLVQLIDGMADARIMYRPLPRSVIERANAVRAALKAVKP